MIDVLIDVSEIIQNSSLEKEPLSQHDDNPARVTRTQVRPTLKTISQLSGFAVPTVSRALSDAPDIGVETKKTVRRIADEIGYVQNHAGLRLRTGRTNVISLVLPIENDVMNHTAQLIEGIASKLRDTPYHLNVTPWFIDEDSMKPVRYIVETKSADALILNATMPQDPRVRYLMEKGFPFATHGRTDWAEQHPYFDFNNTVFAREAVKKLASRGRSHILAVLPPLDQFYSQCMVAGLSTGSDMTGLPVRICDRIRSDSPAEAIRDRILEVLKADQRIDAIFVASTVASLAAIDAVDTFESTLSDQARQIDVYGKESIPFRSLFRRELLFMHEDVRRAGGFLADAVIQAIQHPELPPLQKLEDPVEEPG